MKMYSGMSWIGRLSRVGAKIPLATRHLATSTHPKPFDKILIANRGEIACRVIRSAKKLGVKTVAVYSDVDASSMHVREADEAYCIGPAPSRDSYLCMDKIIDVAKRSGAQAIHPGYGFLSENARFVDLCEASGLVFIGPSSGPMNAMGDKINSKKIAKEAGCFVIPGFEGEVADENEAAKLATEVGYPVMIKASAGGGGKGMRVAYNEAEVREGFRLSQSEARSSFGDDRMLIERFIEDPHHIEIQVLADSHGNVIAFPERECSVQRRNQKVVEESPSCLLTPATRRAMQEQAIMLCKATNYRSAGTIEMLADNKQNFYFLEMNTRLQVEHPVTELVSGEDLVEHMLWIAAGHPLPPRLTEKVFLDAKGWALESRVYAEDPLRGFLPSTGPLTHYRTPVTNFEWPAAMHQGKDAVASSGDKVTIRIDSGVCEGSNIGVNYDPMIAKLCTHAPTRAKAIAAMETALDEYLVRGVGNNISFLRAVYRNEKFRIGDYGTKFIAEEFPKSFEGVDLEDAERTLLVSATAALHVSEDYRMHPATSVAPAWSADPTKGQGDVVYVHLASKAAQPDTITHRFKVELTSQNGKRAYNVEQLALNGSSGGSGGLVVMNNMEASGSFAVADAQLGSSPATQLLFQVDRPQHNVGHGGVAGEVYKMRLFGSDVVCTVQTPAEYALSPHMLAPEVRDLTGQLRCPMPGMLISCDVKVGQQVEIGQQLCCVEAMKMVNVLRAGKAGVIGKVNCVVGAHLKVDQVILEFE